MLTRDTQSLWDLSIIYICDLFMECDAIELATYADCTASYTYGQGFDEIMEKLEIDISNIYDGFQANSEKFHFLVSAFVDRPIKIMESIIKASKEEVLLGVRIVSDVNFNLIQDSGGLRGEAKKAPLPVFPH